MAAEQVHVIVKKKTFAVKSVQYRSSTVAFHPHVSNYKLYCVTSIALTINCRVTCAHVCGEVGRGGRGVYVIWGLASTLQLNKSSPRTLCFCHHLVVQKYVHESTLNVRSPMHSLPCVCVPSAAFIIKNSPLSPCAITEVL